MSKIQDLIGILRGLQSVAQAGLQIQELNIRTIWLNSSARIAIKNSLEIFENNIKSIPNPNEFVKHATDNMERFSTVAQSFREFSQYSVNDKMKKSDVKVQTVQEESDDDYDYEIKLSLKDKELLKKLDMEYEEREKLKTENTKKKEDKNANVPQIKLHSKALRQNLNPNAKERTVPSSRIGRMVSFGSLAAGLGIGTIAEYTRRTFGVSNISVVNNNLFLTPANTERIVDTLCKVRGAALKIGQILSIQDESIVAPHIAQAFERVRRSADFMPHWQVEKVLRSQLGDNWTEYFEEFDMKPFAAASIGQVHLGKMKSNDNSNSNLEIAMKIQYPGVAKGINSDIDNLIGIMKIWNLFPHGMFIDNLIAVAKRELAWEVDYVREAECTKKFKILLEPYQNEYYVPNVIDHLSSKEIFTSELIEGIPVDQCVDMSLEIKKDIARKAMKLCVMEILEFQFMQTDPNWANFFYNLHTKQV